MFNLFRRKSAPPQPPAAAPSDSLDQMEVIARCIQQFMDHDTFVGGLNAATGYRMQTLPGGLQLAYHRDLRIGVVLDERMIGIRVAGGTAARLTFVAASTYFEQYHKHKVDWQVEDAPGGQQTFAASMPFGLRNEIEMASSNCPVDTQFDGMNVLGCSMTIVVKPKA